jgi:hypothetical protein
MPGVGGEALVFLPGRLARRPHHSMAEHYGVELVEDGQ